VFGILFHAGQRVVQVTTELVMYMVYARVPETFLLSVARTVKVTEVASVYFNDPWITPLVRFKVTPTGKDPEETV
jgi:hypothetical protein